MKIRRKLHVHILAAAVGAVTLAGTHASAMERHPGDASVSERLSRLEARLAELEAQGKATDVANPAVSVERNKGVSRYWDDFWQRRSMEGN